MNSIKLISLIGFIKPIKKQTENLCFYEILANYEDLTKKINNTSWLLKKHNNDNNYKCSMNKMPYCSTKLQGHQSLTHCISKSKNLKKEILFKFYSTFRDFKNILFKILFKKIKKFILNVKQDTYTSAKSKVSFFIKKLNIKIRQTFQFFGQFYIIVSFFQKFFYFLKKVHSTTPILQRKKTTIGAIGLNKIVSDILQRISLVSLKYVTKNRWKRHKKSRLVETNFYNLSAFPGKQTSHLKILKNLYALLKKLFAIVENLILNLAYYVTYFLNNFLWKWTKKKHPKASREWLLNKYWVFIQNIAKFYYLK